MPLLAAGCGGDDSSDSRSAALEELRDRAQQAREEAAQQGDAGGSGSATAQSAVAERIEEFGSEAKGAERKAMIAAYRSYLGALAAEDFSAACAQLSTKMRKLFERFSAATDKGKGRGCAGVVERVDESAQSSADGKAGGKVTKVRVEGDRGYVLFQAPGADIYQMRVVREGGDWKAGALVAPVLIPSS